MFNMFGEVFIANLMSVLKHKAAVEYTIAKKGNEKWELTAANADQEIVFAIDVTDEEAMLVMANLSQLPVAEPAEESAYLNA